MAVGDTWAVGRGESGGWTSLLLCDCWADQCTALSAPYYCLPCCSPGSTDAHRSRSAREREQYWIKLIISERDKYDIINSQKTVGNLPVNPRKPAVKKD